MSMSVMSVIRTLSTSNFNVTTSSLLFLFFFSVSTCRKMGPLLIAIASSLAAFAPFLLASPLASIHDDTGSALAIAGRGLFSEQV